MDRYHFLWRLHPTIGDIDREIGAEQGAEPAIDAMRVIDNFGGVVALGIRVLGHEQHALGTEFNAKPASLAPFLDDVDDAVRYLDAIAIQWLSPISHGPSCILH
jgi:hypothetical protein